MDDMQTLKTRTGMRHVPGGTFLMGSDRHCRDERLAHKVAVSDFRMDETAVTNAQFAVFVAGRVRRAGVLMRPHVGIQRHEVLDRVIADRAEVERLTDGAVDMLHLEGLGEPKDLHVLPLARLAHPGLRQAVQRGELLGHLPAVHRRRLVEGAGLFLQER